MAQKNFNNNQASTTLSSGINDTVTSLTSVDNATTAGFPAAPFVVAVGTELMLVSSTGSGTDWTVQRGYAGSTAAAHTSGNVIDFAIIDEDFPFRYDSSTSVYNAQGDIDMNGNTVTTGVPLYSQNMSGATVSGSSFAWKGTAVIPHVDVAIWAIVMRGTVTSGQTYQGGIITVSGGTIASITKTSTNTPSWTITTNGSLPLNFTSPQTLTAGTTYYLAVGRTDSTDTFALPVWFPAEVWPFAPIGYLDTTASGIRIAQAAPAVSDTVDITNGSTVGLGVVWSYA